MKRLTVSTQYNATKTTCGFVARNYDDIREDYFWDPQDKEIAKVSGCRSWFEHQRSNKVVWLLELQGDEEEQTWSDYCEESE